MITTHMYADFEDTVDIEKEFPSITKPSNVLIFSKEDTLLEDISNAGSLSMYLNINNLQHFTSILSSRRSRVQVSSVPHRE